MSERLKSSESYRKYLALESTPMGLPLWAANSTFEPVFGEIRCRFDLDGEACNNTYKTTGALKTHLKKHPCTVSGSASTGNPNEDKISEARRFFKATMDRHLELNHISSSSQRIQTSPESSTPPPTRKPKPRATVNKSPSTSQQIQQPVYKKTNKKKDQIKGMINYAACRAHVQKHGGQVPCSYCVTIEKEDEDDCLYDDDCISSKFFFTN